MDGNGIGGWLRRHPILSYFILAYAISWGWVLALALPGGIPGHGDTMEKILGPAFLGMVLGPVAGGLAFTWILHGRDGLRRLGVSMLRCNVSLRYYVFALAVVPCCAAIVLGIFTIASPDFTPALFRPGGGPRLLLTGIGAGLAAGWLEEIGWTGFGIRFLLERWHPLKIGVVVGALHGAWHLLAGYWGEGLVYGWWYVPYFLVCWIGGLTGLRLLIVWLVARTGSTLLAQLAHASYTGSLMVLWPVAASPAQNTAWTAAFAILLLAVGVALVTRRVGEPAAAL